MLVLASGPSSKRGINGPIRVLVRLKVTMDSREKYLILASEILEGGTSEGRTGHERERRLI